ncbi:MAG: hypothetical protein R3C45_13665 [Phycisphaerales bacterium]
MLLILAKQTPLQNLFETVTAMFSRPDALAQPEALVKNLESLSVVWAVVFLIVGLLCMLNGYRFYKTSTVAIAMFIGLFAGYWIGQQIQAPFVVAGCLGLLLAAVSFPLMKFAVAIYGGITGAFVGANLWAGIAAALNKAADTDIPIDAYWIGALVGLMLCGMLAFILFKLSIVMFTSVSGATIAVLGGLALLLSFEPWESTIKSGLTASQLVVPLLVFVPAVIGLIMQQTWPDTNPAPAAKKPA